MQSLLWLLLSVSTISAIRFPISTPTPNVIQGRAIITVDIPRITASPSLNGVAASEQATATTVSVSTAENGDYSFYFPEQLRKRLADTYKASCMTEKGTDCQQQIQTTLHNSTPRLQSRFVGLAVAGFIALIGIVTQAILIETSASAQSVEVPLSVVIPAKHVHEVQNLASGSDEVIVQIPDPTGSGMHVVPLNSQLGVIIQTESFSMTAGSGGEYSVLINDKGLYQFLSDFDKNETCSDGAMPKRDLSGGCIASAAFTALKRFSSGDSPTFESLVHMPKFPTVMGVENVKAVQQVMVTGQLVVEYQRQPSSTQENIAAGLVLMMGAVALGAWRDGQLDIKVGFDMPSMTAPLRPITGDPISTSSVSSPSSTQSAWPYYLIPKDPALDKNLAHASLVSYLSPTPLRRHHFSTDAWDFWECDLSRSQAIDIISANKVHLFADTTIIQESFVTATPEPVPNRPGANHLDRRQDPVTTVQAENSAPAKVKRHDPPDVLRQSSTPQDDYTDLLQYSWGFNNEDDPADENMWPKNDYAYWDLRDDPTWVYQIGEGVDFITGEFAPTVWSESPLLHPDILPKMGVIGNVMDGRDTCRASKISSSTFGTVKSTHIIFVAMPMKASAIHWVFAAIHDDIIRRRERGVAGKWRTVISSPLNFRLPYALRDTPHHSIFYQIQLAIQNIVKMKVAIVQAVGGWYFDPNERGKTRISKSYPAGWEAISLGVRWNAMLLVGGVTEDLKSDYWPPMGRYDRLDGDLVPDIYARSANVRCVMPGLGNKAIIQGGSAAAAAAAAVGIVLQVMTRRIPKQQLDLPSIDGLSIQHMVYGSFHRFRNSKYSYFSRHEDRINIIRNGLNGAKSATDDVCQDEHIQLQKRQAGNSTECPLALPSATATVASDADIVVPSPDSGTVSIDLSPFGPSVAISHNQGFPGPASEPPAPTSSPAPPTSAPPPPTSAVMIPTAIGTLSCSTSTKNQNAIASTFAASVIDAFCLSTSRQIGYPALNTQHPQAMWGPAATNNKCFSVSPCRGEVTLDKNEAAAKAYDGFPTQECKEALGRLNEGCQGVGGRQKVGMWEMALYVPKCG